MERLWDSHTVRGPPPNIQGQQSIHFWKCHARARPLSPRTFSEPSCAAVARASASSSPCSTRPPRASRRKDPRRSRATTCPRVRQAPSEVPVRGVRRIRSPPAAPHTPVPRTSRAATSARTARAVAPVNCPTATRRHRSADELTSRIFEPRRSGQTQRAPHQWGRSPDLRRQRPVSSHPLAGLSLVLAEFPTPNTALPSGEPCLAVQPKRIREVLERGAPSFSTASSNSPAVTRRIPVSIADTVCLSLNPKSCANPSCDRPRSVLNALMRVPPPATGNRGPVRNGIS